MMQKGTTRKHTPSWLPGFNVSQELFRFDGDIPNQRSVRSKIIIPWHELLDSGRERMSKNSAILKVIRGGKI